LNTTNISRRQVRRGGHVKLKESSDERTWRAEKTRNTNKL
jgi:hypothetical protein